MSCLSQLRLLSEFEQFYNHPGDGNSSKIDHSANVSNSLTKPVSNHLMFLIFGSDIFREM